MDDVGVSMGAGVGMDMGVGPGPPPTLPALGPHPRAGLTLGLVRSVVGRPLLRGAGRCPTVRTCPMASIAACACSTMLIDDPAR